MSSIELAKNLGIVEKTSISALHRTLKSVGQLKKADCPRLKKILRPKQCDAILRRVNETRTRLGGGALDWTTPRIVFNDYARILESDAKRIALTISKQTPRKRYQQWRRWIFSNEFYRDAVLTPFFDECADLVLGLDERKMQREVRKQKLHRQYKKELAYLDLTPEELFTPYRVLLTAIKKIPAKKKLRLIDLGCGWGRAGLVLLASHPRATFIGYELVEARAKTALTRVKPLPVGTRFEIEICNLNGATEIAGGDYYFLFNPFNRKTLRRVFRLMQPHLSLNPVIISVLFGQPFHTLKRAPWARKQSQPLHFPEWPGKGVQFFQARPAPRRG